MTRVLWKLPAGVPIMQGPFFRVLPKRVCEIHMLIEDGDGNPRQLTLKFDEVMAFKTTFLPALASADKELRHKSYCTLVGVDGSTWLKDVQKSCDSWWNATNQSSKSLTHCAICFDDGPFYEVICTQWSA